MMTINFCFSPVRGNNYSRCGSKVLYIVVHDTGNSNRGAGAMAHKNYVATNKRGASAHYFVDDSGIVQFVGDSRSAGAVGDGKGRFGITNRNSISIEMCINSDGDYDKMYFNTVELVKNLMVKFKVPIDRVVRHYDASRKSCPNHMKANNWAKWWKFKEDIKKPILVKLDLSKDSVNNPIEIVDKNYYMKHGLFVIESSIDKLYVQEIGGKTLRQTGAYGINGVFFDPSTAPVSSPNSTCAIAVNRGKPIGPNAHKNHPKSDVKRATLVYGEGKLTLERINSIEEVGRKVDFALGGVGLIPSYDPKLERVPSDILRSTNHTGIAFKGSKVYLIVSIPMSMAEFKNRVSGLGVDGAIALDGGGSSQMFYKENFGIHSNRKLNNMVGIMA